jgi:hypothetical protein
MYSYCYLAGEVRVYANVKRAETAVNLFYDYRPRIRN